VEVLDYINDSTYARMLDLEPLDGAAGLRVDLAGLELDRIRLAQWRGTPFSTNGLPPTRLVMHVSEHGYSAIESRGMEVSSVSGAAAIIEPCDRYQCRTSAVDTRYISVDWEEIASYMGLPSGSLAAARQLAKPLQIDLNSAMGFAFRRACQFVWDQSAHPGVPLTPLIKAALDEILLHSLVALLQPLLSTEATAASEFGSTHMRLACEMIRARVTEPVRISDVAAALQLSPRHLQASFRRHLGTTPQTFLRDCRLDLAQQRLSTALPADTTTSIAHECGFSHLGDFARHYRIRFGESPSETLRRARGWRS
jgi:AraC-like DNA-binding protein